MDDPIHFLNLEWWFRLIYETVFGTDYSLEGFQAWMAVIWNWVTLIGYLVSVIALIILVYAILRIKQVRLQEKERYGPLPQTVEDTGQGSRWKHIESLMESNTQSDWRQAIIEADIMLDDMLTAQGYAGESVGEKLKQVERADFETLNDAWEAHKVRNDIAHRGSAREVTEGLARRTIARYENVFREFNAI